MDDSSKSHSEIFDSGASKYEASTGGCTHDLARSMLSLSPPLPSGSVIHDNACGTGIVAQEIIGSYILTAPPPSTFSLTIRCTDKSSSMITLAQSALRACQSASKMQAADPSVQIDFQSMESERLQFADDYFSHSFTNCGILWFDDAQACAKEILRTLRPEGRAYISSWKELAQFEVVREAQQACGHLEPLFRPPVDEKWFEAAYLRSLLEEAGFEDVEVVERTVHFAGRDVEELCTNLMGLLGVLRKEWDKGVEMRFREQLKTAASKAAVKFERPGVTGPVEELVGIPMVAMIGVARKGSCLS